jgi:hypothetical protein
VALSPRVVLWASLDEERSVGGAQALGDGKRDARCVFCINAARDTALEGMIEILLDDNEDMTYDEAYALVNDSTDMWDQVDDMIADHDTISGTRSPDQTNPPLSLP